MVTRIVDGLVANIELKVVGVLGLIMNTFKIISKRICKIEFNLFRREIYYTKEDDLTKRIDIFNVLFVQFI